MPQKSGGNGKMHQIIIKQSLTCPTWHRPLIQIVPDGIEVKCRSCRDTIHHIKRERLEQAWKELEQEEIEQERN